MYIETDRKGDHTQITVTRVMDQNAQIVIDLIERDEVLKNRLIGSSYGPNQIGLLKLTFFTRIICGVNAVNWERVMAYLNGFSE